ncbi:MAG: hypothetical protein DWI22_21365 [Planctomycetota bacterium]|nr:MAG: hypothetical protein DWI22_21365 [Planctomycetota bacterium]
MQDSLARRRHCTTVFAQPSRSKKGRQWPAVDQETIVASDLYLVAALATHSGADDLAALGAAF